MLPYGRQTIEDDDLDAVAQALRSDWLTTGPRVDEFEAAIALVADAPTAVAVTSGTAALHAAYAATGIGPGDEVVTTPITFVATAAAAALCGAKVVFADVDEDTGNLNPEAAEAAITDSTRVVAAVDFAGHPVDMPAFAQLAERHDLTFLQDAAHSIGSSLNGAAVGSVADLTTFSFFPTKNMTSGEGGAIVGTDSNLVERARSFKGQGLVRAKDQLRYPDEGLWHQEVHEFGLNYRLPDVLCALGISQIAKLERFKERREQIHQRYNEAFASRDDLILPGRRPGASPAWHLYPLRVEAARRRAIFDALRERGIGVQVNYIPAYWHPVFEDLGYQRGMCPVAEQYYAQEISLPLFPGLTDDDVDRVIEAVLDVTA